MNAEEKKRLLISMKENGDQVEMVYSQLEQMGDLKKNYRDYLLSESINVEQELERLPDAGYALCSALLTMLLREAHFINGSFEERFRKGQVEAVINRMLFLLS